MNPTVLPSPDSVAYVRTPTACVFAGDNALAVHRLDRNRIARTSSGIHSISLSPEETVELRALAGSHGYTLVELDGVAVAAACRSAKSFRPA